MLLGKCSDGRALSYDEALYEFRLDGDPVGLRHVLHLDDRGLVRWRAMELRDWMRRIDPAALQECHRRAEDEAWLTGGKELTPEQQVLADAARDDGVLAGRLVDADPALVQAVADELEKRGLVGKAVAKTSDEAAGEDAGTNPLAEMDLPRGMEALSQMERAQDAKRDMTRAERRLMKRILKNDDKAKAKRERNGLPPRGQRSEAQGEAEAG